MWQWVDDEGHWQPFKRAAVTRAEEGYTAWQQGQQQACIIATSGTFRKQRVLLDFDSMTQVSHLAPSLRRCLRESVRQP